MRVALALLLLSLVPVREGSLLAQSGGHVVSGVVRDEGSNSPLSAVKLQLLSGGMQVRPSITTGVDGTFSFTGLSDGEYSVTATKTGYDAATVSVTIIRTGSEPVMILMHPSTSTKSLSLSPAISAHDLSIPDRARLAYDKGRALLEDQNKPAAAISEFQRAIDAYPPYYEAYTGVGVANYQLGKLSEAEAALLKAIDLSSSKSLEPLYLLADIYNGQRKYSDAELLARRVIALDDQNWNGHFELARALVGLRRAPEAESHALRARELKPDSAPVRLVLGNVHMLEQNYQAALADFNGYLDLEPNGPLSSAVRQQRDRVQNQLHSGAGPPASTSPPANSPTP